MKIRRKTFPKENSAIFHVPVPAWSQMQHLFHGLHPKVHCFLTLPIFFYGLIPGILLVVFRNTNFWMKFSEWKYPFIPFREFLKCQDITLPLCKQNGVPISQIFITLFTSNIKLERYFSCLNVFEIHDLHSSANILLSPLYVYSLNWSRLFNNKSQIICIKCFCFVWSCP